MSKTTALRWGNPARNLGYGRAANPAIPLPKRPHEFRQTLLVDRGHHARPAPTVPSEAHTEPATPDRAHRSAV